MGVFTGFNSKYDNAYLTELKAELAAAENMKNDEARSLEHESLRVEMIPLADVCRGNWQSLKLQIAETFGSSLEVQNWNAAGWQLYSESATSWEKLMEMCRVAMTYLETNEAKLIAAGMPASFKDDFNGDMVAFELKYNAFILAKENSMQGTFDKVEANNVIFTKVAVICEVGQHLFRKDEVKKKLFSMEGVSELIKPTGAAGLKGTVTQDGVPQAGLLVELENGNKSVFTDAEGGFDFGNQLASGKDTIIVRRGDEILAEDEVVIPPGVTKREEVKLVSPIPTPVAPTPLEG